MGAYLPDGVGIVKVGGIIKIRAVNAAYIKAAYAVFVIGVWKGNITRNYQSARACFLRRMIWNDGDI